MAEIVHYINSRERIEGTSSDFLYTLPREVLQGKTKVSLLKASIPKSYYGIDSRNNTFILKEGLSEQVITLDVGNYSIKTLITELGTLLTNGSPNGWTYSVKTSAIPETAKLTFTVTGNTLQPELVFTQSKMYERLGFEANSTNLFVGDNLTSVNVINLVREQTLFLRSGEFIKSNGGSKGDASVIGSIFSSGWVGYSSIVYQNPNPRIGYIDLLSNTTTTWRFYLTDEDAVPIDLNGNNFVFALLFFN